MQHYTFHPKIVLRTPREAFSSKLDEQAIKEYIKTDNPFLEAVYLGSPSLYTAFADGKCLDKKKVLSIAKYIIRNRSRSTPFGLFSGVGVAKWGNKTDISVETEFKRHTRLDMNYLCALVQELNKKPALREHLLFFPNSSLYLLGEDIRYVESRYTIKGHRTHQISSIKSNTYIKNILHKAQSGMQIAALSECLVDEEVSYSEAYEFINKLIDAQLIVSELEPAITGPEFMCQILDVLKRINTTDEYISIVLTTLEQVEAKLRELDSKQANSLSKYSDIIKILEPLDVRFDESKLFQVDKINELEASRNMVSDDIKNELLRVIKKLNVFAAKEENPNIADFISRFSDRYQDEEIPLLNALDAETGIGYLAHKSGDYTPLTEDIILPNSSDENNMRWHKNQRQLFKSLQNATFKGLYEISYSSIGLDEGSQPLNLCPTISTMFRIVDKERIYLESIGGSSAANLIGRFGHASEDISQILHDISQVEEQSNPDVIFAEIVHLPESRTGNILLRPAFRKYEIPYLANSKQPLENQVHLQDIDVSVRNGKIILRHKKLNKIIIPRLGTAHNFAYNALPVYQFLCDLQTQGLQNGIVFSWGEIAKEFVFLPRVIDGKVILNPATWQFSTEHLKVIQKKDCNKGDFELWRLQYNLPQTFVLVQGDNELFIDTSNPLLVEVFLDTIKNENNVLIKEYLWDDSIPVKNAEGRTMTNQIVATLIQTKPIYDHHPSSIIGDGTKSFFSIGSEWIYLKLYCGAKSADMLLQKGIHPMVQEAKENGWIDKWFFIRFTDPNNHLRIRFHVPDVLDLKNMLQMIETYIKPFEESGVIWKIQTDTYKRELERYGHQTIEQGETYFSIDSDMYLDFLNHTAGDQREDYKWLWGLQSIETLLTQGGLELDEKKQFMEKLKKSFTEEFNMTQDLKSQLDRKYRANRRMIETFIHAPHPLNNIIEKREDDIRSILENVKKFSKDKYEYYSVLSSYVHMLVNRLISSNQRLHELLMYDFLYRHYVSLTARQRKTMISSFSPPA